MMWQRLLANWRLVLYYFASAYFIGLLGGAAAYWYTVYRYGSSTETLEDRLIQGGIAGTILFLYWIYRLVKR